jgi:hypothetical protein
MGNTRTKSWAGFVGGGAVMVAMAVTLFHPSVSTVDQVAGGSGDSPTNAYTQPSVPAMSIDPTNQKVGSTMTMSTPAPTLATALASPTFKATAAPGCVNNGQCP